MIEEIPPSMLDLLAIDASELVQLSETKLLLVNAVIMMELLLL